MLCYEFRFAFYEYEFGWGEESERFSSLEEAKEFRKKFRDAKKLQDANIFDDNPSFLDEHYGRFGTLKESIGLFEITERKLE